MDLLAMLGAAFMTGGGLAVIVFILVNVIGDITHEL